MRNEKKGEFRFAFMKNRFLIFILFCMLIPAAMCVAEDKPAGMPIVPDSAPDIAEGTPVAMGDGFVLTQGEVNEFREFVETKTNDRTIEEEYRRVALQIWLAAKEAKALGLDKEKKETGDTLKNRFRLANLYGEKIINEYKPNDLVFESYYLANPDKFKTGSGDLKPLNDDVKKEIKEIIVKANKKKIHNKALEQLKQKYHVRLCNTEKGGCE